MTDAINGNGELEIETLAKRTIDSLYTKKHALGVKRQMLKNVLKNDSQYRDLEEEFKKAKRALMNRKSELMHEEANEALQATVNDLIREVKTEQLALSDYLRQYRENTGSDMIENNAGVAYIIRGSFGVRKESKADRWLRKHREDEAKMPLPGFDKQNDGKGRATAVPAS